MATLLKTLTADGSRHHTFKLNVYHIDTDVINNTSYISWEFLLSPTGSGWDWSYSTGSPVSYTITINGQSWSGKIMKYDGSTVDFYVADAVRIPVVHTVDGSKSIDISFNVVSGSANYLTGSASASGSAALPKIGRASTITCPTTNIGSEATITINKQDSGFNHILTYSFEGLTGNVSLQTSAATVKWVVPTGFYAKIHNSKSGNCTITCKTIYNGKELGSTTGTMKVVASEALCAPTLSPTISCDDTTYSYTGDRNKFISGFSGADYSIGAAARNSATLQSQRIICGNVDSTNPIGTIKPITSNKFTVRAYDSRGYLTTKEITKTLIAYIKPTISIEVGKPTTDGKMSFTVSGQCYNASFGAKSNVISVGYRVWENGQAYKEWTKINITIKNNKYSATVNLTGLNYLNSYTVQADISDSLTPYRYSEKITVKSTPIFDWSESDFNFNVPVTMMGNDIMGYNKLLWQGAWHMGAGHTIELKGDKAISAQPRGIVLVFSSYENEAAQNYGINTFFISKEQVSQHSSAGNFFMLGKNAAFGTMGGKYLYIKDDVISGQASNTSSGTAASGITFNNAAFVLREVIGV